MKILVSFSVLLALSVSNIFICPAQNGWTVYNTGNTPLLDNTIRALIVDAQDRKWVGTDFGLGLFDDTNWSVYTTSNSGMPGDAVRTLYQDDGGDIWVGTQNAGLARFDGSNWIVYNTGNSSLPDNQIRTITQDTSGNYWIGTTGGLVNFDGSNWLVWDVFNSPLVSNNIADVVVTDTNMVCIGTVNGGLTYINLIDTSFTVHQFGSSPLPDNTVLGIAIHDNGLDRWVGCPSGGMLRHIGGPNGVTWLWYHVGNSAVSSNSHNAIEQDSSGLVLMATQDAGLVVFDGLVSFWNHDTTNSAIPENHLLSVAVENSSVIWVGTQTQGLAKLDRTVGAMNAKSAIELKLSPNPLVRNSILNLNSSFTAATYRLLDPMGTLIRCGLLSGSSIRLDDLSTGIYFITILEREQLFFGCLVVTH